MLRRFGDDTGESPVNHPQWTPGPNDRICRDPSAAHADVTITDPHLVLMS